MNYPRTMLGKVNQLELQHPELQIQAINSLYFDLNSVPKPTTMIKIITYSFSFTVNPSLLHRQDHKLAPFPAS